MVAPKVEVQLELLPTEDQVCGIPWSQHRPLGSTRTPIRLLGIMHLRLAQLPYYVVIDVIRNLSVLYLGQNLTISIILT